MDRYATLRNGLVGAWCPSLGATGRTIVDRSPYRDNAALSGSFVWKGDSIDLSAASTHAELPDRPWHTIDRGFSVSAWFTLTTTSISFTDVLVSKDQSTTPFFPWNLRGITTNSLQFVVSNTTTSFSAQATVSSLGLTTGRWYHACGTFDLQNARLYVNGRLAATSSAFSGTPFSTTAKVRIGDSEAFSGRQWPGLIDDVRLWQRGLTASEVAMLATNRGIGLLPTRHRRALFASTKQMSVRVNGAWASATPYVNVNGVWQQATPFARVDGVWK